MSIQYNLNQMFDGSSDMNKSATLFDDIVADLHSRITSIVSQGFLGQASQALADVEKRWEIITNELNNSFARGAAAVGGSASKMGDADRQGANQILNTSI